MPVKPTDEVYQGLQAKTQFYKRTLAAARKLVDAWEGDDKEAFWTAVKEVVQQRLDAADNRLRVPLKLTPDERLAYLTQKNECEFFIGVPDLFKNDLPNIEASLKKAEADEREYRAKLAKA
jgi:hypothetical protein